MRRLWAFHKILKWIRPHEAVTTIIGFALSEREPPIKRNRMDVLCFDIQLEQEAIKSLLNEEDIL
jgi:hypothetical protein